MQQINKKTELNFVSVSQPVAANRLTCRDLPLRLHWDKSFRITEKKREATIPHPHGKVR